MLKNGRSEVDYPHLLKRARHLVPGHGQRRKLALLVDVSTQHLVLLLRVLFESNGVDIEIYEAGYDTVQLKAYNPASELYAFQPQMVVILQSPMKLKGSFYDLAGHRNLFSREQGDKTEGVWKAIQARTQATIIQSTFVLPYERPFGNFGLKVTDNLQGAVSELKGEICL